METFEYTKSTLIHWGGYKNRGRFAVTVHLSSLGNQAPYFAITAEFYQGGNIVCCGCMHDEIRKAFPELAPFIKWHLVGVAGPMHYVANSIYHAEQGDLEAARSSAIWPEAELDDFTKEKLEARLPQLLQNFEAAMVAVKALGDQ